MAKKTTYQELMAGLKVILKKRGYSYRDVSEVWQLSESSVKRIFSAKDGSLGKIEELCDWLGLEMKDLVELSLSEQTEGTYVMTQAQESYFLKKPGALQFFVELYEYGQSPREIKKHYQLSEASVIHYLNELERIGLIEVHPNDRIKFKFSGFFTVSEKGKLARKVLSTSMESIHQFVLNTMEGKSTGEKKSTMTMGELLFKEATLKELMEEYATLRKKMYTLSSREMRLYPKKELIPYQYILGLIPERILKGKIPNVRP